MSPPSFRSSNLQEPIGGFALSRPPTTSARRAPSRKLSRWARRGVPRDAARFLVGTHAAAMRLGAACDSAEEPAVARRTHRRRTVPPRRVGERKTRAAGGRRRAAPAQAPILLTKK
jgi:hypothetical protein